MAKHTKARSFEISKLKNLHEKPWNPPEVTRIFDPPKFPTRCHHSFKLGSKLNYLNSDQLLLSKRSRLKYSKSGPTNVEYEPNGLMTKTVTLIKPKGRKQCICCFLQYQILTVQKHINHDEYWYHVKQFTLVSANSYRNFHILFLYYVLYFPSWTSTLYFSCFPFFFIDCTWKQVYCPFKQFILVSWKIHHQSVKHSWKWKAKEQNTFSNIIYIAFQNSYSFFEVSLIGTCT